MKENTLICTRIFDVPVKQVWEAYAQKDALEIWWGPNGFCNTSEIYEFHPEGKWEFVMHGPNGADYKNSIIFKEIRTHEYIHLYHLPQPGFTMKVVFVVLSENSTAVTMHQIFDKKEDCETLKNIYPTANEENFERLDAYLQSFS